MQRVTFIPSPQNEFLDVLTHRINAYFTKHNISKKANWIFYVKGLSYLTFSVTLYVLILGSNARGLELTLLFILFGLSLAIFTFSVAHDASHNAVSNKPWVNRLFASLWHMVGMSRYFWELKHNIPHHSFTNIPGNDEHIDQSKLLRLNPKMDRKWFHKFQHIYAFVLYSLISINLVFIKDFKVLFRECRENKEFIKHPMREVLTLLATKFIFVVYTILIPKFILDISWVEIITCNLAMHLAMGIFIGIVLLPAHITNETEYLLPDREGKIHSDWALHQMLATVDFSANNYFINWISGGLNTHVVHHLFPSINHIHYYRLTKIIRKTALECNIPYRNYSLGKLLVDHLRFLKALGQKNNPTKNSQFD